MPLRLAAKVDKADEAYFREAIAPLLQQPGIEFIGEINERAKSEFLGRAAALLFPIDWPEPFGLVMIEAMACGTPILAFAQGSVPEIIEDGVTGRIVSSVEEAVQALPQVLALDRRAVRERFEQRFSSTRMARDYVRLYRRMMRARRQETHAPPKATRLVAPAPGNVSAHGRLDGRMAAFEPGPLLLPRPSQEGTV
jgi:glycosyltransferase involved in cell wall biosynthesis